MMARTKKDRRSYSAGERGRNRVRVFPDHGTGIMQIEWRENGRRISKSLEHRDFETAKKQADEFAAKFVAPKPVDEPEPLTLGRLFEMYLEEVTPRNSARHQSYDRMAVDMFLAFFGGERDPCTLSRRDFDRFVRDRSSGEVGPSGRPVGARTVQKDLSFLSSVLNWGTVAGDGRGGVMLERNPLKGYELPRERNPLRVALTDQEYEALLSVSPGIDWRFRAALILAHETGHRIGAVRQLRWSDVDLEARVVRWRASTEKTGHEHFTPMTQRALEALEDARRRSPGIGEAPVFPAPQNAAESVSRYLMRDWWERAEAKAMLEPKRGRGWHSLRRKFASDLLHRPLKVVCELGGWRDFETVLKCYQRPDEVELREALEDRRRSPIGA